MSASDHVDFLVLVRVRGFFFNPHRPEGVTFRAENPSAHISVKPAQPDQDGSGRRHGLDCRVYSSRAIAAELKTFAEALLGRQFKMYPEAPISLPLIGDMKQLIDPTGKLSEGFELPLELYPPALQSICDEVGAELRSTLERFFKLIRWQQEIDGPHDVFEGEPALYWKTSPEGEYNLVGRRQRQFIGKSPAGIEWGEIDRNDFSQLWANADAAEPLGHELLREAQEAVQSAPRSALLLAASALEAGVKMHIARLSPETAWLMTEAPAPPVFKMLRDYLPQLHASKGVALPEWGKLLSLFRQAEDLAVCRNKLTHRGEMPDEVVTRMQRFLATVSDLLYVLDFIEGHKWARENVNLDTQRLLGWPTTRRKRAIDLWMTHPSMLLTGVKPSKNP